MCSHWVGAWSTGIILPLNAPVYPWEGQLLKHICSLLIVWKPCRLAKNPFHSCGCFLSNSLCCWFANSELAGGKEQALWGAACSSPCLLFIECRMRLDQHICPRIFWSSFAVKLSRLPLSQTLNDAVQRNQLAQHGTSLLHDTAGSCSVWLLRGPGKISWLVAPLHLNVSCESHSKRQIHT